MKTLFTHLRLYAMQVAFGLFMGGVALVSALISLGLAVFFITMMLIPVIGPRVISWLDTPRYARTTS